jgi:hypothetical protein
MRTCCERGAQQKTPIPQHWPGTGVGARGTTLIPGGCNASAGLSSERHHAPAPANGGHPLRITGGKAPDRGAIPQSSVPMPRSSKGSGGIFAFAAHALFHRVGLAGGAGGRYSSPSSPVGSSTAGWWAGCQSRVTSSGARGPKLSVLRAERSDALPFSRFAALSHAPSACGGRRGAEMTGVREACRAVSHGPFPTAEGEADARSHARGRSAVCSFAKAVDK